MVIKVSWTWGTGIFGKLFKEKSSRVSPDLGIITFDHTGKQEDVIYYGNTESDDFLFVEEDKLFNVNNPTKLSLLVLKSHEDLKELKKIVVTKFLSHKQEVFEFSKTPEWKGKHFIVLGNVQGNSFEKMSNIVFPDSSFSGAIKIIEKILISKN